MYDYFYGLQSEQFSFYRIPKVLFTHPSFKGISTEAKTLYGILLDRMNLSAKNQWIDEDGRVYIIYTIGEVMGALGCAEQKAVKLLAELEKKADLIERKRQGLGRPNLIYVKNFLSGLPGSQFKNGEIHDSGTVETAILEPRKSQGNNTDTNNTENSDTDPSLSGRETKDKRKSYEEYFRDTLEIGLLKKAHKSDRETLDGIVELLTDTCCSRREMIRIAGDDKPAETVKSRFMKLDPTHIEYVLKCLADNTTKVRDMKQYLLAVLYNAPATISPYYQSWVNHDMAGND